MSHTRWFEMTIMAVWATTGCGSSCGRMSNPHPASPVAGEAGGFVASPALRRRVTGDTPTQPPPRRGRG